LGIGASGDVAVYDLDPAKYELSKKPKRIVRSFSESYLTLLGGEVVVRQGEVKSTPHGRVWSVHADLSEPLWKRINKELEEMMSNWFAHSFQNYPVPERYRSHLESRIPVDASHLES
jgi:formylmethanofuran dehydrogenase subunit A